MIKTLVVYLIIGIVLCVVEGDMFGIYLNSFWGELLLSAIIIVMWLPIVVSVIIVGIITWLF